MYRVGAQKRPSDSRPERTSAPPAKPADSPPGSALDPVGRLLAGFGSGAGNSGKVAGFRPVSGSAHKILPRHLDRLALSREQVGVDPIVIRLQFMGDGNKRGKSLSIRLSPRSCNLKSEDDEELQVVGDRCLRRWGIPPLARKNPPQHPTAKGVNVDATAKQAAERLKQRVQRHSPDRLFRKKLVLPGGITISAEKHKGRLVVRVETPEG